MYGGAAGGGKSDALLMDALGYADVPGYSALILRRTYPDLALPGAIMDRSHEWLEGKAKWNDRDKQWRFESGARLTFGFLATDIDQYRYQSAEFQFCVAAGTPILMGDNTWLPIQEIQVGDEVQTLLGPRTVRRLHRPGVKEIVEISTPYGTCRASATHPVLTEHGWASPRALLSTLSRASLVGPASSPDSSRHDDSPHEFQPWDQPRVPSPAQRHPVGTPLPATGAWTADARTGYAAFGGSRPELEQPRGLYVPVALHGPALPSGEPWGLGHVAPSEYGEYGAPSSRDGCLPGPRSHGGQHHWEARALRGGIPSPAGVAVHPPMHSIADDPGRAPGYIREFRGTLAHPYTMEAIPDSTDVLSCWARMAPAGAAEVMDLTVDEASHYISYPGIYHQNCGFDELTQFEENQYRYMFSRLRRPKGGKFAKGLATVPLRMRGASNPGGVGHAWVKKRFPVDRPPNAKGPFFVPAKIQDNPHLDQVAYISSLDELDTVTRQRYLEGDWGVFEDAAFPEFVPEVDKEFHVVKRFPIPENWNRFEGLDHGRRNPTAWHHWAVDYDGNVICAAEYYMPNKLVRENVPEIKKARARVYPHGETDPPCWADPSIKNRTGVLDPKGREISVELEYVDCGQSISYAQNDRRAGYVRLSTLITPDPERPFPDWHPRRGEWGAPSLFVFEHCLELIDQFTTAIRQQEGELTNEAIDADWEGDHGHACASARYAVMSRPRPSKRPEEIVVDPRKARMEALEDFEQQTIQKTPGLVTA